MFTQFKSVALVSMMAATIFGASAATIVVDGISYSTSAKNGKNYATVAKPASSAPAYTGDIVIPATVTDKGVTYEVNNLAAAAFKSNANITSVDFSATSTPTVARGQFQDCKGLKTVKLPETITTITQNAFQGCLALEELTIPAGVVKMYTTTFQDCVSLKKLVFADATEAISIPINVWGVFTEDENKVQREKALESLYIGRPVVFTDAEGNAATGPANVAFANLKTLKSVEFGGNLTSVPSYICQNCVALESVKFNENITEIGGQAFYNTGITELVIPNGVTSIASSTFYACKNLAKVTLGNATKSIGELAFSNTAVKEINLPETLITIGAYAFNKANLSGALSLPASLTTIGEQALAENANLTEVTLPAGINRIGAAVFKGDKSLAKIALAGDNSNYAIDNCGALVDTENSCVVAYPVATAAATYTSDAKELGAYALYGAANITAVELPNCAKYGDYCLSKTGLLNVNLSGEVGRYVLANCAALKSVKIQANEVPVGICAGASALESYENQGNILIVRQDAFKGCTALKNLNLGKRLVIIEADAFADVDGLNLIVGANTPASMAQGVFTPNSLVTATVPASLVDAYKAADQWCNLKIIGDENIVIGGKDISMPSGLYYAGVDGNLHCAYESGEDEDVYEVNLPHMFQLQQFANRIYGASAGKKFVYSATAATEGDGKLFYISSVDGHIFQATVLDNAGNNAYLDPFALYVYGSDLYVNDRNVALRKIPASSISLPQNYPSFAENNWFASYNNEFVYGCIKAGFSITEDKDAAGNAEPLYWIGFKHNGQGIFRFKEKHIGTAAAAGPVSTTDYPYIFKDAKPVFTTFYIDEANRDLYIYLECEQANLDKEGNLKAGVYRFKLDDIIALPNPAMLNELNPQLIDGSPVAWEGAGTQEHVGVPQFNVEDGYLYWCHRAPSANDVAKVGDNSAGRYAWAEDYNEANPLHQSGIKRIKLGEANPEVEMVLPGVEGYGVVPLNYKGSKKTGVEQLDKVEKTNANLMVACESSILLLNDAQVNVYAANGQLVASENAAADQVIYLGSKGVYLVEAVAGNAKQTVKMVVK